MTSHRWIYARLTRVRTPQYVSTTATILPVAATPATRVLRVNLTLTSVPAPPVGMVARVEMLSTASRVTVCLTTSDRRVS